MKTQIWWPPAPTHEKEEGSTEEKWSTTAILSGIKDVPLAFALKPDNLVLPLMSLAPFGLELRVSNLSYG